MAWTITMPGRTASLNELLRGGKWGAYKLKRRDKQTVALACRCVPVPDATTKRRVSVHVVYTKGQRRLDPDALQKSLGDALVACRAVVNDSPKWLEWGLVTDSRGQRAEMRVTLENCP